jgi:hypothetical protein
VRLKARDLARTDLASTENYPPPLANLITFKTSLTKSATGSLIERIKPGHPQQNGRHERLRPSAPDSIRLSCRETLDLPECLSWWPRRRSERAASDARRRSVDLWRRAQFNYHPDRIVRLSIAGYLGKSREQRVDVVSMLLWAVAIVAAAFVAYNLFHYVLFLLATHPKDAGGIGHVLNEFEQRQLVEWVPKADDFLKHDDHQRRLVALFFRPGHGSQRPDCVAGVAGLEPANPSATYLIGIA